MILEFTVWTLENFFISAVAAVAVSKGFLPWYAATAVAVALAFVHSVGLVVRLVEEPLNQKGEKKWS